MSEFDGNYDEIVDTSTNNDYEKTEIFTLNDDCWMKIVSYLDLKSVYSLERSSIYFKDLMSRTNFWQKKMKKEFPNVLYENVFQHKSDYKLSRELYWEIFRASHVCNVCMICFVEEICSNIPNCERCDWIECLD